MKPLFPTHALPRPPRGLGMAINVLRQVAAKGHCKGTLARAALKAIGVKTQ